MCKVPRFKQCHDVFCSNHATLNEAVSDFRLGQTELVPERLLLATDMASRTAILTNAMTIIEVYEKTSKCCQYHEWFQCHDAFLVHDWEGNGMF